MGVKDRIPETDEKKDREDTSQKQSISLKGTLFFVMSLGVFIILSWSAVYAIFITR